jgi:hypothetical protein
MRSAGLQVAPAHQAGSYAVSQDCSHLGSTSRDPGMLRGLFRALCIAQGLSCALSGAAGVSLHVYPM